MSYMYYIRKIQVIQRCMLLFHMFFFQLIHRRVVDTALVFPHRLGLPFKRALRNLVADHLMKIIQSSGECIISVFIWLMKAKHFPYLMLEYFQRNLIAWMFFVNVES